MSGAATTAAATTNAVPGTATSNGLAVGMNKGHVVSKRTPGVKRSSYKKGTVTGRGGLIKSVVAEVCGFAPYEKRIIELLRIGKDKRALKFAKKRLGTHLRAKRKREQMSEALRVLAKKN